QEHRGRGRVVRVVLLCVVVLRDEGGGRVGRSRLRGIGGEGRSIRVELVAQGGLEERPRDEARRATVLDEWIFLGEREQTLRSTPQWALLHFDADREVPAPRDHRHDARRRPGAPYAFAALRPSCLTAGVEQRALALQLERVLHRRHLDVNGKHPHRGVYQQSRTPDARDPRSGALTRQRGSWT